MAVNFGSALEFEDGTVRFLACCEIDTDKFVVAYCDLADADAGKCRVATVSGTTISWGAINEFASDIGVGAQVGVCKLDTDKFVVVYADDALTDDGYARVGSVSGNTITGYGVAKEINIGDIEYPSCSQLGTDKFAVLYNDEAAGDLGTVQVCTVSGTTITAGDKVAFEGAIGAAKGTSCCKLDTDKFLALYPDNGDSAKMKACAFTVSGTVPSPGAIRVIDDTGFCRHNACAQLDTDKAVIAWLNHTNSIGYLEVCTVSGTTISEGTAVDFNPTAGYVEHLDVAKINATSFALVYEDVANSEKGTVRICTFSGDTASLNGEELFLDAQVGGANTRRIGVCLISENKIAMAYVDDADVTDHGEAIVGSLGRAANRRAGWWVIRH